MSSVQSTEIERISRAIDMIEKDKPSLKTIIDAFRELLVARTALKMIISGKQEASFTSLERDEHSTELPLLSHEDIASLVDPWGDTVKSTLPPLANAFPNIKAELAQFEQSLNASIIQLEKCIVAVLNGDDAEIDSIANRIGVLPETFKFIVSQVLKPFVEKRTESLQPLARKLSWHKGYCPICGSGPELSYLRDEGQRWLRCALCGYEWIFSRMRCPHCEHENDRKKELVFIKEHEHEWVEFCTECHRYIVNIDLREKKGISTDVAAIGMVHLDLIAQEKGFAPIACCAWNMVDPGK